MSRDDFDPPEVDPNDDERRQAPPGGFDPYFFLFEEMTEDDWRVLIRDLGRFAATRIRRFHWVAPPDPEEVALECVDKILLNPSMWKPDRRRDSLDRREALKRFLFQVIWRHLQRTRDLKYEAWRVDNVDATGRDLLDSVPKRGRSAEECLDDDLRRAKIREAQDVAESSGLGVYLRLRYLQKLKPREIAELLGVARKTVYTRLQQLRELLKRHLGGDDDLRDLFDWT